MLCRKFIQIFYTKPYFKSLKQNQYAFTTKFTVQRFHWIDNFIYNLRFNQVSDMCSAQKFKFILRDFNVRHLWSMWSRSFMIGAMMKKCSKERTVRDVIQCFRQTILKPKRTLLLSAAAAYHRSDSEDTPGCDTIGDQEMEALKTELESVDELSAKTLYCVGCGRRLVIDKKRQPGVLYCACKIAKPEQDSLDGWIPYMEADKVIIWRKEHQPEQGLYVYKVYGRYGEVRAPDFAAVQVDGLYRRLWDSAVAALAIVESDVRGVPDQTVLHWEVLWPKLFSNRDYVYIRRHKDFDVKTRRMLHKDFLFSDESPTDPSSDGEDVADEEAGQGEENGKDCKKRIEKAPDEKLEDNKLYIIVSRSCEHPDVPVAKNVIRVAEYWSHMVVRTLDGVDQPGTEFVLTYYDAPAAGGLPGGVAAWASGRAAPAYLQRMRRAALHYQAHRQEHDGIEDVPDTEGSTESSDTPNAPECEKILNEKQEEDCRKEIEPRKQESIPSSDQSKEEEQTEVEIITVQNGSDEIATIEKMEVAKAREDSNTTAVHAKDRTTIKSNEETEKCDQEENNSSWWRYLYPFYYFI